jgi:hypothetical protein
MVAKAFCLLAQSNAHITREKYHNRQKKITPICTSLAARVRATILRAGSHGDSSEGVTTY